MLILAIDPGTTQSGWCVYNVDDRRVLESGVAVNDDVSDLIENLRYNTLAIEMMEARGMPLGNDSLQTVLWTGRFVQRHCWPDQVRLVYRSRVKLHLCGSARAKDANIRQALIDKLGPPGTKRQPGPTYGVTSHAWAALAVAVTVAEGADR